VQGDLGGGHALDDQSAGSRRLRPDRVRVQCGLLARPAGPGWVRGHRFPRAGAASAAGAIPGESRPDREAPARHGALRESHGRRTVDLQGGRRADLAGSLRADAVHDRGRHRLRLPRAGAGRCRGGLALPEDRDLRAGRLDLGGRFLADHARADLPRGGGGGRDRLDLEPLRPAIRLAEAGAGLAIHRSIPAAGPPGPADPAGADGVDVGRSHVRGLVLHVGRDRPVRGLRIGW